MVKTTSSGRDGPFTLYSGNCVTGDPATQKPDFLTEEAIFKAKSIEERRYSGTLQEDMQMDGNKDDRVYWYVFATNTKTVIFMYRQPKEAVDSVAELEKSLSTLEFRQ